MFLANQLVSLQGEMSQKEFGELLEMPQPNVSRLQNAERCNYRLQTLLDIAEKLDVALIVRFVDYPTFLKFTSDFSDEAMRPASFSASALDRLASALAPSQMQPISAGSMMAGNPTGYGIAPELPAQLTVMVAPISSYASMGGSTHG